MQSYQEFEHQQAREIMEKDLALTHLRDVSVVDRAYSIHQNQRKTNKRVNLAFNRLAFSVKQQISEDRQGERHGNVD